MNKSWLFLLLLIFISPLGTATSEDPIRPEECLSLVKYCSNCTFANVTSLTYPNGSIEGLNIATQQIGAGTFTNGTAVCGARTAQIGVYEYSILSNKDGILSIETKNDMVTANGRPLPSGIVIVAFSVLYMALMAVLIYFISFTLIYFVEFLRTDVERRPIFSWNDLLLNLSGYILVWVFYGLALYYVGNPSVNNITGWLVFALSWTNLALPILAFILSFVAQGWEGVIKKIEGKDGN